MQGCPSIRENTVERLLGLTHEDIHELTKEIIIGILRSLVMNKNDVDIKLNTNEIMSEVVGKVNDEINKLGIKLININFNRISTLGEITEKQDSINITGNNLVDSKINKIELGKDTKLST